MPVIITPPEIERRPRRPGENDGSHGRRPPNNRDLKRTGGGGDNDSNDEQRRAPRNPRARLHTFRIGLFCVLTAVFMFFLGIVFMFFHAQTTSHVSAYGVVVMNWHRITIPPILWLNTAVLLLSSVTIEFARRHIFHEIDAMEEWFGLGKPLSHRVLPWLVATLALGLVFLAGQVTAWHQLAAIGLPFHSDSPGSHSFYIMTCAHAVHLAVGVLALVIATAGLYSFKAIENRQIMVDMAAWYWHSMGALWLILLLLLVLFQ